MARIYVFHLSLVFRRENGGESVSLDDKREKRVNLTQNFVRRPIKPPVNRSKKISPPWTLDSVAGSVNNAMLEGNRCLFP